MIGYGAQAQASNSLILGGIGWTGNNLTPNVGIGTTSPTSLFHVAPNIYDTGTASTSASATVVGSGTTWTANMVGMEFIFANGSKYTITGFTDATHMTLSSSSTNSSQVYRIHNPAFYVSNTGATGIRTSTNTGAAFRIQNASGVHLFVADTTNMAVKVGGGDVSPDASPALLVLDYKNTSGDPTGVDGAMYYNSNDGKFRCRENGFWDDCIVHSPRKSYNYTYDFMSYLTYSANNTNIDGTLIIGLAGTGTQLSAVAGGAGRPGVGSFTTGTGTTNVVGLTSNETASTGPIVFGGSNRWEMTSSVRFATLSTSGETYTARVGFSDVIASTSTIANGCYFRYTDNGGATPPNKHWTGVCVNGGSESTCDMGYNLAASTWYDLKISVNGAANSVTFSTYDVTNGAQNCSAAVTSNIPTSNTVGFGVDIKKSAGFTARTMDADYFTVTSSGNMSR